MAMSLLVCDLASQHFSNAIVPVAREADFPDLGRRVPWIIRRDASDIGSASESKRYAVTQASILAGGHFPGNRLFIPNPIATHSTT